MGLNYRAMFALGAAGVPALIFVVGVLILLLIRCIRFHKARSKAELSQVQFRPSPLKHQRLTVLQGEDVLGVLLSTGDESKIPKWRRVVMALIHLVLAFAGGLTFVSLSAFEYLPFWAAGILASILTLIYWAIVSDYLLVFWQWRKYVHSTSTPPFPNLSICITVCLYSKEFN